PLAVVAPIDVARPVPVVGLIRGEVERAVVGQVQQVGGGGGEDQRDRQPGAEALGQETSDRRLAGRGGHEGASVTRGGRARTAGVWYSAGRVGVKRGSRLATRR